MRTKRCTIALDAFMNLKNLLPEMRRTRLFIRTVTNGEYTGDFDEYMPGEYVVLSDVTRSREEAYDNVDFFVYPSIRFKTKNITEISVVGEVWCGRSAGAGAVSLIDVLSDSVLEVPGLKYEGKESIRMVKSQRIEQLVTRLSKRMAR